MDIEKKIKQLQSEKEKVKDQKKFQERLDQLRNYYGEDRIVTSQEILDRIKEEGRIPSFPTGISHLDNIIGGIRKEQLIIVAAPPKSGKSTFSMQLTANLKKHNPLFFALEQSPEEMIDQMLENGYEEDEIPYFLTPNRNSKATINWIEDRIVESIAKHDTGVVFIDHFHYLNIKGTYQNVSLDTEEAVMALKNIARRLKITLFLVVHLNRVEPGEAPTFSNLYGSTGFHKVCDLLLMMYRKAEQATRRDPFRFTDETVLSVQANRRNGKTGNIDMKFNGKVFLPITSDYEADVEFKNF